METLRSKVFPKIATQDPKAFAFDVQKIKEVDSLFLKKGKSIKGIKQAVLHFAENGMLCAVKENGFFLTMPIIGEEDSTVKDYFVEDNLSFPGEHIFLNAFSKKKYEEIFRDLVKIFPDLGFENPKEVYSGKDEKT